MVKHHNSSKDEGPNGDLPNR